jgi:hypothetical protein
MDQELLNKPLRVVCMLVPFLLVFMTGCSAIGKPDDPSAILDRELTASVVHVQGNEDPGQLNRLVQPGTVVVWLNKCAEDVRIVFPERKVTIACLNPVSFNVNAEGIFDSKVLPPGAVASLCFIQPGLYVYTVERLTDSLSGHVDDSRLKGTIVVK